MSESDPLIKVVVRDPVIAIPAAVMFDASLSVGARLVAALWFLKEREPTLEEVAETLRYGAALAQTLLAELRDAPSMRRWL